MAVDHARKYVELQGLRGVAVLLVVLDHALSWPSAGFLGVDVFFVISGFVITKRLLEERRATGRIDLVAFARRRIRRLAPAAVVTIGLTLLAASALAASGQRRALQLDALASFLGVANWRFAFQEVDYFDRGSTPSPFRHFWSLGVEEQFYLFLPLVVAVLLGASMSVRRRRTLFLVTAAATLASLVRAASLTNSDPTGAYFDTTARGWELLIGVLVALIADRGMRAAPRVRECGVVLGIGLVAVSTILGREDGGVPIPLSLAPVLGCAIIVLATVGAPLARAGAPAIPHPRTAAPLRAAPLARLGDASYSVYLWHWPVIVLLPQVVPTPPILLAVAGVAFGLASHRLVEQFDRSTLRSGVVFLLVSVNVVVLLVAVNRVQPTPDAVRALDEAHSDPTGAQPVDTALSARRTALSAGLTARSWPTDLEPSLDEVEAPGYAAGLLTSDDWGGSLQCGDKGERWAGVHCSWGAEGGTEVLVVGDSTAVFTMPGWRAAAETEGSGIHLRAAARYGCPFIDLHLPSEPEACDGHVERVEEHLRSNHYDVVVITNRFWVESDVDMKDVSQQEYGEAVARQIDEIQEYVGVVVVAPPPPPAPTFAVCKRSGHPFDCASALANVGEQIRALRRAADGKFIEEDDLWCVSGRCPALVDGQLARIDATHVSPRSAESAGPVLAQALSALSGTTSGDGRSEGDALPAPGSGGPRDRDG